MSNQEIIDNAPEGATHATCGMYYWKWNSQSGWRIWCDVLVMWTTRPSPTSSVQSIADIKRIVELEALVFQSYIEGYSDALDGESKLADAWKSSSTIDDLRELKEPKP